MSFGLQLAVKLSFRGIITELNCKDCIGYLRFGITFSNALGIALQDCVIFSSNLQSCSGLLSNTMAIESLMPWLIWVHVEIILM